MVKLDQLPISRRGLTEFTFARYLVPWMCDYEGEALFLDGDMLCLADITEMPKPDTVRVVKEIEPFEWPSLMYFNCEKFEWLTPEYVDDEANKPHALQRWPVEIQELHKDWNHIVPYSGFNTNAKIVHFTQGIPCFEQTRDCEYSEEWHHEVLALGSTVSWDELMGPSIHKQRMGL